MPVCEFSVISLCARFAGRPGRQSATDLEAKLRLVLAEMLPSTLEEIAEAAALETAVTLACLEDMAAGSRVMFNPLTKRFSLPRSAAAGGLAA